ncbi:M20/M25/M40 family metallo-hydrolase [Maribellus comscasis]|uniref:Carboxypeptidase Q n=1 Tax=Maribellus comscasis TaxID=2681766 RepID=A0A6I6JW28_9BACT|nr:M20/M25/M40 family metallo-hydrolase [Maribellus comscasis]QGY47365.1 M20/M25/M40 family metallo-hydrolase [Maribellus comscasis]
MNRIFTLLFAFGLLFQGNAQTSEDKVIQSIFDEALTDYTSYRNLEYLCKNYPGRITGSEEVAGAVEYTFKLMKAMQLDTVFKQEVQVPHWIRGDAEKAFILSKRNGKKEVPVISLGMSVGTGKKGLTASIVEVHSFEELEKLGVEKVKGKIVFFNRPMDPTMINTFGAYGGAGNQRTQGAAEAAKYGAVGALVRSLTNSLDDFPHTGVMRYDEGGRKIPAVAISTNGAELLSSWLKKEPDLKFHFENYCETLPETISYNVIGEISGSEYPDEIITVGGHIDAWEPGEGAHDDGAGCMQSIEMLRIMKELNIRPKRTIRAVMFMDEEIAQRGGQEYARQAELKNENHYFALEADRGAFQPLGFGVSAPAERLEKILELKEYFAPYGITRFTQGGGGVDISPLGQFGTPLSSYIPEMQRYFDMHHCGNDTFEQVNFREFQMGSAAIASFIYLIDKFDL